jgi:hypothetical protein
VTNFCSSNSAVNIGPSPHIGVATLDTGPVAQELPHKGRISRAASAAVP